MTYTKRTLEKACVKQAKKFDLYNNGWDNFYSTAKDGCFYRERELCKPFKSNNKNFTIAFDINSKEVTIYVCHFGNWDSQKGKVILETLWKNFKLPFIGWKIDCKLLNYKGFTEDDIVSEYVFTMRKLDFRKAIDIEFLNYNSEYISTPQ